MNAKDDLPRRRRAGPVIGGLALLAALGGGGFFYSTASGKAETKPKAAAAAPQAIPVQTSAVMTKDIPVEQSGLGIVTPLTKVDVKVRIDGQLQKMKFAEGQDVSAGDVIAEIDPKPYEVAVDQAQATYNKDLAQLNAARIDEARAKRLTDTGSGTTQSLDTAAAQVAIYQATVDGDKAAVDKAKLDLSYASVTAPISGRAGFNQAEEGAIVRTSDTTGIVTITQMRPINVQFTLTQDELPALTAGQAAGGLPVVVNSRDGSKHLADGRLQVIDSQVDSTTGMVKLKALFPNDDGALWPGELVSARILLTTHKGSTVVPIAAILNGQTGAYVFVVKPDKTVASVPVTTGPAAAGMVTVAGLNLGDVVVTSGQSRLSDGTLISEAPAAQNVASSDKEQIQ
ncbi:efflux RND transporter periplasmic adaptor subunit [Neorhizobium alkalisoli]|uniref:Multidrug efflux system membrane fusion protein n=1 Tax=Neorhizobium alkalisoli TaxID=528178 RepID=A0A561R8V3_9HYPH|nr:efflux RND transporter periplasmic adaptor subunit [Neorhizobium alkalisoli]TWF59028.1 multidrug efflux system membrane fusion protein [Neorhizobium alkalisoli]